jgi:UDP-glucose 4-epimerase
MGATIYVFGGAGFIGKSFSLKCAEAVVCDSDYRLEKAGLTGVPFDFGIDSPEGLPCGSGDVAVIFSWRGYPAEHDLDPVGKLSINLSRTLELLRFLASRGVSKILYASTGGAVYGDLGEKCATEDMPLNPIGFYGIGKATAEMYVRKICREAGMEYFIFRIGNAYGVGQVQQKLSVGLVAKAVLAGFHQIPLEIWGDGENRKDYIHVDDVAEAFISAIESPGLQSGFYNVGGGISYSTLEIIESVEKSLNFQIPLRWLEARGFDVKKISLDSNLLQRRTGWKPLRTLEDGINEMAKEINL